MGGSSTYPYYDATIMTLNTGHRGRNFQFNLQSDGNLKYRGDNEAGEMKNWRGVVTSFNGTRIEAGKLNVYSNG